MTEILQPGRGPVLGDSYLPARTDEVRWGWLPNQDSTAVLAVAPGSTVTIDTVSHEGLLFDQGRDPVKYLAQWGVRDVLDDAVAIAASDLLNDATCGPHVVTGPIDVDHAEPGDVLRVDIIDLARRVPYGFVSNRHGFGALAGEFPEDERSLATRDVDTIVTEGTVSHFARVGGPDDAPLGLIDAGSGRTVQFPLAPFLGLMGVAPATSEPVHSVPPGPFGGNLDVKHAGVATTIFLPVQVPGALFYAGDPHFAQGNGEVALTAFEASLRATVRLGLVKADAIGSVTGGLPVPVVETATHWIPTGLHVDLNEAMKDAVRNAVTFLEVRFGVPRSVALAYLSAAADFEVSQVVDAVKGIHCMIRKADWTAWV